MSHRNYATCQRLISVLLIACLLTPLAEQAEAATTQQQATACGTWNSEREPRIELVDVAQQLTQDCGGLFRLKNDTDIDFSPGDINIASWGGYTLELEASHDNSQTNWVMLGNVSERAYLFPAMYTEIYAYPVDSTLEAAVTIQGDVTGRSITFDTALFLIKTALSFGPSSCVLSISEEQLIFLTFRVYGISSTASTLAFQGRWRDASREYLRIAEEFYEELKNSLGELGINCAAEFIVQSVIGRPTVIARIGTNFLSWAGVMMFHYFQYDGQPAIVRLGYTPSQPPASESTSDLVTGEKIAFISNRDGNAEIYIINSDGTGLTNLTNHPANDLSPTWSSDGQKIAFVSDRSGVGEIYVMNANGDDVRQVTSLGTEVFAPVWSPDGERIAFRAGQGIYWVGNNGNDPTMVYSTTDQFGDLPRSPSHYDISWSPDSLQLLFAEGGMDSDMRRRSDLWVVNVDGTALHTVAQSDLPEETPVWSPDSQRIAFVRQSTIALTGLGSNVFLANRDGNQEFNLTANITGACCPKWSPDGQWLALVVTIDPTYQNGLYIAQVDSGQLIKVFEASADYSWSPDSQYLALSKSSDIYVTAIDGGNSINLTDDSSDDSDPAWQPIGSSGSETAPASSNDNIVGTYRGFVTASGEGGSAESPVVTETNEFVVEIQPACGSEDGCIELGLIDPNSSSGGRYCPVQNAVDSVCFQLLPDGSLSYEVSGAGWGAGGILYKVDETSLTSLPAFTSTSTLRFEQLH